MLENYDNEPTFAGRYLGFAGGAAMDTQKIRHIYNELKDDPDWHTRTSGEDLMQDPLSVIGTLLNEIAAAEQRGMLRAAAMLEEAAATVEFVENRVTAAVLRHEAAAIRAAAQETPQ